MPRRGGVIATALSPEEQQQVAHWLGEFLPPARIPSLIAETFGKRVSHHYGYEMLSRRKWQSIIDRHRQEWLSRVYDVPLANKKVRLQELQRLWENATQSNANPERQEARILLILSKVRLEMEEKKPEQTTYFFGQFNYAQATDEELLARRAELVKRIQEFRWPTTRRLPNGMGRSEGAATSSSPSSQDAGGIGGIGDDQDHGAVEGSSPR